MEELKILVDMVASLPGAAVWVLVLFFCYKTFILGSVYGLIRLIVLKWHNWVTTPKDKLVNELAAVDRITVSNCMPQLLGQLERLQGIRTVGSCRYIHSRDVQWLTEAITEKMDRERANEAN